ncbi:38592_t:CDS:1, partial [Gigaspora margarita]
QVHREFNDKSQYYIIDIYLLKFINLISLDFFLNRIVTPNLQVESKTQFQLLPKTQREA